MVRPHDTLHPVCAFRSWPRIHGAWCVQTVLAGWDYYVVKRLGRLERVGWQTLNDARDFGMLTHEWNPPCDCGGLVSDIDEDDREIRMQKMKQLVEAHVAFMNALLWGK